MRPEKEVDQQKYPSTYKLRLRAEELIMDNESNAGPVYILIGLLAILSYASLYFEWCKNAISELGNKENRRK